MKTHLPSAPIRVRRVPLALALPFVFGLLIGCDSATPEASAPSTPPPTASEAQPSQTETPATTQDTLGDGTAAFTTPAPVHVLSYRPAEVMEPLLARFTAESGIPTQLEVRRGEGVVEYFENAAPGEPMPDLIIVVDSQRLNAIAASGVLRPLPAAAIDAIPAGWRDPEGRWAGLGWRLRAVLQPADGPYVGYRELIDLVADGARVCVRGGDHVYNRGLITWLEQRGGEETAQSWRETVHGARQPVEGGDRDQIRAVADGRCDYAVVNHYYFANLLQQRDDESLQHQLSGLRFGPSEEHGQPDLYANVSGLGLPRDGGNPEGADQLAVWLTTPVNHAAYAEAVYEFPAAWPDGDVSLPDALTRFKHLRPGPPLPPSLGSSD